MRKSHDKERTREYDLLSNHNLSTSSYNEMLDSQEGKCAICGEIDGTSNRRLYVDHCHNTNNIRGLLCVKCNSLLGQVNDSVLILHYMTVYILLYKQMKYYEPLPKKRLKYNGLSKRESDYRSLLKCRYGITPELYDEIYNTQGESCATCGIHQSQLNIRLCIDHNHNNNQVRGLLCNKCNRALGFANDNVALIHKAMFYLSESKQII